MKRVTSWVIAANRQAHTGKEERKWLDLKSIKGQMTGSNTQTDVVILAGHN